MARVLIEVDQSQAESRFVDLIIHWLTGKTFYRERALSKPKDRDVHTERAAGIYKISEGEVTSEQRYMGKRTTHAWQRYMQAKTFVEQLSKEGYTMVESEGKALLQAMTNLEPEIEDYFKYIRLKIHQDRVLWNSWGRPLWFTWHILDERDADQAYREGFSYHPQSECADLEQQRGVKVMFRRWVEVDGHLWQMNIQAHDAIVFSADPSVAYRVTEMLVRSIEAPRHVWGVDFSMPCEIKVGLNWGKKGMVEFKELPGRKEFEEVVYGTLNQA